MLWDWSFCKCEAHNVDTLRTPAVEIGNQSVAVLESGRGRAGSKGVKSNGARESAANENIDLLAKVEQLLNSVLSLFKLFRFQCSDQSLALDLFLFGVAGCGICILVAADS